MFVPLEDDHWKNYPCILSKIGLSGKGYSRTSVRTDIGWKLVSVHRLEWEKHNGQIPEGYMVCHRCDVRNCKQIYHLFLGTNSDNMQDMKNKNRDNYPKGEVNGYAKLNEQEVLEIKELVNSYSCNRIAKAYGVSRQTISSIKFNRSWRHLNVCSD